MLRVVLAGIFAVAALLAFAAARRSDPRDRQAWLVICAILATLGAAKLLGLQEVLTGALRNAAKANGLYVFHREAQAAFALLVGLFAVAGAWLLGRRLRHAPPVLSAAAAALGVLLVLLIVRAASIHAVDVWTTARFAGMRRGWWLEAAAEMVIAACAAAYRPHRSVNCESGPSGP
jgi:hypothetical protein